MGKNMISNIQKVSKRNKISFLFVMTLVMAILLYQGFYSPRVTQAGIPSTNTWTTLGSANPNVTTVSYTAPTQYNAGGTARTGRIVLIAINMMCANALQMTVPASMTVTLGGVTVNKLAGTNNGTTLSRSHVWMGYVLDANIPAGLNSVVVSTTVGGGNPVTGMNVLAASYSGVDQTTPIFGTPVAITNTKIVNHFM